MVKRTPQGTLRGKTLPDAPSVSPASRLSYAPRAADNTSARTSTSVSRRKFEQAAPLPDLYSLSRQALDETNRADKQQRAWRSIQSFVSSEKASLDSWSGPRTPLAGAVEADSQLFATLLLQARADVQICDGEGKSPLHLAAKKGSADMCKALLKFGADVNARDYLGQTPLFTAPSAEVCRLLVERHANPNALNEHGQSALHVAAKSGLQGAFNWLASRADRTLCGLDDASGATAMDYAEQAGLTLPMHYSSLAGSTTSTRSSVADGVAQRRSLQQPSRPDSSPRGSGEADWHPAMPRLLETHDQLLRELSSERQNELPMF